MPKLLRRHIIVFGLTHRKLRISPRTAAGQVRKWQEAFSITTGVRKTSRPLWAHSVTMSKSSDRRHSRGLSRSFPWCVGSPLMMTLPKR